MLLYTLTIGAIGLAGGVLPLLGRRSERLLHLFIPVAAGVFLGVVFMHMLPEVAHMAEASANAAHVETADSEAPGEAHADEHAHEQESESGHDHAHDHAHDHDPVVAVHAVHGHDHGGTLLWFCVLLGLVGLYLLENLVFRTPGSGRHQHVTLGYASLLGLSVHAFTAGLGLAGSATQEDLLWPVYLSIVSHKLTETFSLATVFMLAGFSVKRVLAIVALFSLVTPAGVLVGTLWVSELDTLGIQVLVALAAGTFLFVAVCDLLPEVFHHREDAVLKVVLLAVGVAITFLIHQVGG